MMGQYDRVAVPDLDGHRMTRRQRQALKHGSGIMVDRFNLALHYYQGSWRPRTDYSGTSHMGAGVVDAYVYGMSSMKWDDLTAITRILRRESRQAAYLRGPFCGMPWHWHICDLDTHGMDPQNGDSTPSYGARWQVGQYRAPGGPYNGLQSGVKDVVIYRPNPIRKWDFKN